MLFYRVLNLAQVDNIHLNFFKTVCINCCKAKQAFVKHRKLKTLFLIKNTSKCRNYCFANIKMDSILTI